MHKSPTHYERLRVARDASPDQIKKAFRRQAQLLHPDRNPAADAADRMSLLNVAHDVLADAGKRAAYDLQLAEAERRVRMRAQGGQAKAQGAAAYAAAAAPAGRSGVPPRGGRSGAGQAAAGGKRRRRRSVWRWALLFMTFCAAGAWMGYDHNARLAYVPTDALPSAPQTWVKPSLPALPEVLTSSPVQLVDPAQPECVAPAADPNGAAWPVAAGYLNGMPKLRENGWSQIVLDNSAGKSAVYAKVMDAVGRNAFRHAYVPAGEVFTFARMDAGYYQLKYMMLDSGCAFASNRILLEETAMGSQVKATTYRLTLTRLKNNTRQFSTLRQDQF